MGVSGSLHRISALKNHHGTVCGLTYRIGRHVRGKHLKITNNIVYFVILYDIILYYVI